MNALTNATINSYKRLVAGFEAPVMLAGLDVPDPRRSVY
jgi:glutamine synthetase